MAIVKITSPLATAPNVFASPVINQLLALAVDCNHGYRIGGGVVKKGSLWNIGGVMFIADADTAILGSKNQGLSNCAMAIKFSVSGNKATATYVSNLTGVSWNGEYQGYYDASGNMYYYKCKKEVYTAEGSALLLGQDPVVRTIIGSVNKELYRIGVEHTGSYNFYFPTLIGGGYFYVNGVSVYLFNSTTPNIPLFLEEGDILSVRSYGSGSYRFGGLCNDTFGSVVVFAL